MNELTNLVFFLAEKLSEETILNRLKDAISDYENAVTDSEKKEAEDGLNATLTIITAKFGVLKTAKREGKSTKEVLESFERHQKGAALLNREEDEPGGKN